MLLLVCSCPLHLPPHSGKLDYGTTYELCLPLQHTSTGHIKLTLRKDRSGEASGTRWDPVADHVDEMRDAVENLQKIMPKMVTERIAEGSQLKRRLSRKNSGGRRGSAWKRVLSLSGKGGSSDAERLRRAAKLFGSLTPRSPPSRSPTVSPKPSRESSTRSVPDEGGEVATNG